jgi:hypothetical protein
MTERPVGSAAEEAAKLFAAVEEWARTRAGGLLDSEHLATGAPECRACPVCQAISAARNVRPETVEHLLDAASSFVAALRTAAPAGPADGAPAPGARVEHIDVDEV